MARGSFLLGNTLGLQRDQLGTYAKTMAEHGDIASFRVGPPGMGFGFDAVFSPEGARRVLTVDSSHYIKDAPVIGEFRHFLGNGLLVSEGERWRRDRRIAAPLFTRQATTSHLGTIAMAATDLVSWCQADAAADRPVDLHDLSMRYALHALGHTVFGDDIVRVAPTLRSVLPALGQHLKRRSLAPLRTPHSWPTPANRRAEGIRKVVWGIADELIAERRGHPASGKDLLSRLLDARDPETGDALSDDDVRDEAIIFLIAGHETTGSALAFTLQLLGRQQEIQERVRAEVAEAVGRGPERQYEVDRLPYTAHVVSESMRLYPPAHTVVRRASEKTELLGYPVSKGRIVAVNIWGIHHRRAVWSEPSEFRPDRSVRRFSVQPATAAVAGCTESVSWSRRGRPEVSERPVEAAEHVLQLTHLLGGLGGQRRRRQAGAGHQCRQLLDLERRPDDPWPVPVQPHLRPRPSRGRRPGRPGP